MAPIVGHTEKLVLLDNTVLSNFAFVRRPVERIAKGDCLPQANGKGWLCYPSMRQRLPFGKLCQV